MLLEGFGDGCEVQDCQQRDPCFASPRHPRHGCLRPSPVQITGFRSEAGSGVPWDSKQGTYKFLPVPRGLTSRKRCALHILENSPEAARIPARTAPGPRLPKPTLPQLRPSPSCAPMRQRAGEKQQQRSYRPGVPVEGAQPHNCTVCVRGMDGVAKIRPRTKRLCG